MSVHVYVPMGLTLCEEIPLSAPDCTVTDRWRLFRSGLSNRHRLFGERTPGRCWPLRLDHTSPAVMIAVSRSRSLYHRLNSDVKDTLAVFSLYGSDTSTVNLSRDDDDPLVCAIRRGDLKAFNDVATSAAHRLLKENKDGWMPLHDAAFCGQTECLKTILKAHPGLVDKRTLQEQTALLLAVSCEHLSCARCLLEGGADPDISSKNKETPLYKACELENMDMVRLILSYGATVNQRCAQGWTALHEAVSRDNTEICETLIRAGASINPPNTYSIAPLTVAAQRGQMRALCHLIEKGADVNAQACDGVTALYEASKNGHREAVSVLLSKNADANKSTTAGLLPLHAAAQHGDHQIVSLLVPVTSRARLRHSCVSPLHLAAERNRHAAAAVLLKTGADVNATLACSRSLLYADRRATALYIAVASGGTETAEVLLNAGASLTLDPCLLDHGCDALSCFSCTRGRAPHTGPEESQPGNLNGGHIFHSVNCGEPPGRPMQFCEWISTADMRQWAGPVLELLLQHVAQVQLCGRLLELLDSREEWHAVKRTTLSPRPLQHLCRLQIRTQMGRYRLKWVRSLPLPDRLIRYLSLAE
ncbi:hypothetical protein fugu_016530 [Takifugu bimaculatus]|uniref:SOCS box domain-containing protein n=1 Tax=Takifugu bimaculatus TaxID=433685 RepID=A0A4Z2BUE9_9TELE|nr:hypothetical protein fugu_016530 [Takifugu bimaculatus]